MAATAACRRGEAKRWAALALPHRPSAATVGSHRRGCHALSPKVPMRLPPELLRRSLSWLHAGGRRAASSFPKTDSSYGFPREQLDMELEEQIRVFARMRPHPLSLQQILDMNSSQKAAKFISKEIPLRYAERIVMIESLAGWEEVDELVEVHEKHVQTFRDVLGPSTYESRASFNDPSQVEDLHETIKNAALVMQGVQTLCARGMHKLHGGRSSLSTPLDPLSAEMVDRWLNDFLLNWIGTEMLLAQFMALERGRPTGIVDPRCDVAEVCREVALHMLLMCDDLYGRTPVVNVLSRSAVEEDQRAPSFAYVPSFLKYILQEILKNSCRATLESTDDDHKIMRRPITILVCADEKQVGIKITDLARGIPFHIGSRIWSYMYSTARLKGPGGHVQPTPLAGYGVGLPISRLYARYLGGALELVSWPGYGTDVHLFLPRVQSDAREVIPEEAGHHQHSMSSMHSLSSVGSAPHEEDEFVQWVFTNKSSETKAGKG